MTVTSLLKKLQSNLNPSDKERVLASWLQENDINAQDAQGMTVLHHMALSGDEQLVDSLLKAGAKPHLLNRYHQTPAHFALTITMNQSADAKMKAAKARIFNKLCPAQDEKADQNGHYLVHLMAIYGFDKLLTKTAALHSKTLTATDNFCHTPLHCAILNGHLTCAEALLNIDEELIKVVDHQGRNALHYAALSGSEQMLDLCLRYNPDVTVADNKHLTARDLVEKEYPHNKALIERLTITTSGPTRRI